MRELLIISQNSSANQLLKSRLEKEGYSVETVEDGNRGFQKAKGGQYAAILIDFNLPEATGSEICYVLKHGSKSSQSKILFLAAENEEESCPLKMDVCSDGFICTQDTLDDIINSINNHLCTKENSLSA
jgi:two-component system phosphate regulon response regulator PhoB